MAKLTPPRKPAARASLTSAAIPSEAGRITPANTAQQPPTEMTIYKADTKVSRGLAEKLYPSPRASRGRFAGKPEKKN